MSEVFQDFFIRILSIASILINKLKLNSLIMFKHNSTFSLLALKSVRNFCISAISSFTATLCSYSQKGQTFFLIRLEEILFSFLTFSLIIPTKFNF